MTVDHQELEGRWKSGAASKHAGSSLAPKDFLRRLYRWRPDGILRSLLAGGLAAALIKIGSAATAYVMFVVLARLMPAEEYGRFAFAISLAITLSIVFSFGLPVAALRFWPQHNARGERELAKSFMARAFFAVVVGSFIASFLCAVGAALLTRGDSSFGAEYVALLAVTVALMSVSEFVQAGLRADGVIVRALAPRDILWRVLVIAASIGAASLSLLIDAEFALWLCAGLLALITLPQAWYLFRRMQLRSADFFGPRSLSTWSSAARPIWGASVLVAMIQQFDVVLLGMFVGPEETGPYFAALRTATLITLVLFAANMVAAPLTSKFYHGGDMAMLHRMNRILATVIALPTLAGFAVLVFFGRPLLSLFDPAFEDAYLLLIVLAAGFAITALAGPANYVLQMVGLERENLKVQAMVYVAVIFGQCILAPRYGALGVAIPNMIGAAVASCWSIALLRGRIGVDTSLLALLRPVRRSASG